MAGPCSEASTGTDARGARCRWDSTRSGLMRRPDPGMVPDVAAFAVITASLHENARQSIGIEPFEALAAMSHSLTGLPGPLRTAAATDALIARCAEALMTLSIRTRAIAESTVDGARSYEAIEGSILHSLTAFPSG